MMLIAGIAFAAIIAICEFTWRKRKLAVDENVSVMCHCVAVSLTPIIADLHLARDARGSQVCHQPLRRGHQGQPPVMRVPGKSLTIISDYF